MKKNNQIKDKNQPILKKKDLLFLHNQNNKSNKMFNPKIHYIKHNLQNLLLQD